MAAKEVIPVAIIGEDVRPRVQQKLSVMERPVELIVYGDEGDESRVLMELCQEMAELNDKIKVRFESAPGEGIEQVPALVFVDQDGNDHGIRYYGLPVGYEFTVLMDNLIDFGTGKTQLSAKTKEALAAITQPTVIKVFVTPT